MLQHAAICSNYKASVILSRGPHAAQTALAHPGVREAPPVVSRRVRNREIELSAACWDHVLWPLNQIGIEGVLKAGRCLGLIVVSVSSLCRCCRGRQSFQGMSLPHGGRARRSFSGFVSFSGWYVSKRQSFPAEQCTVTRWSMLFTSAVRL